MFDQLLDSSITSDQTWFGKYAPNQEPLIQTNYTGKRHNSLSHMLFLEYDIIFYMYIKMVKFFEKEIPNLKNVKHLFTATS